MQQQTTTMDDQARMEAQKGIAGTERELDQAATDVTQDRDRTLAEARARLAKIDVTTREYKTRCSKLAGTKKSKFATQWTDYMRVRSEVDARLSNLERAPASEWSNAKTSLDKSFEELDAIVDKLDDDL